MSSVEETTVMKKIEKATVVLLDIAGTSSSICFVKETLFSYVVKNVESFLTKQWENTNVQEIVTALREVNPKIEKEGEQDAIINSIVTAVKELTENNSDVEPFKKLQGLIYADGYANGDLKGHVFADVATQLPLWANGKRICVYSTGSVESQKLLFTHSTEGDLSAHLTEYFDMAVGPKTDASSYKKIVEKLECKTEDVLFLTDSTAEAKAATEAGMMSILVSREGNEEITEETKKEFSVIKSFTELSAETTTKRKITEATEQEAPPAKVAKTEPEIEKLDGKEVPAAAEEKMEVEVATEAKEVGLVEESSKTETAKIETELLTEEKKFAEEKPGTENKTEIKESEVVKDVPSTDANDEKRKTEVEIKTKDEPLKETMTETKETESKAVENEADKVDSAEVKKQETEIEKKEISVNDNTEIKVDVAKEKETVPKVEEEKSIEEIKVVEETKEAVENQEHNEGSTDKVSDKVESELTAEEVSSKNGDTIKNGAEKLEEKENKSDLANGAHIENGDESKKVEEESDIKVKKIESETETEAVSVEVKA